MTLQEHANRTSDDYLAHKLRDLAALADEHEVGQALLRAAADRLGEDVYPSRGRLEFRPTSKGVLIDQLYYGVSVDGAIPSAWIDRIYKFMPAEVVDKIVQPEGLAFHFCTVYENSGSTVRPLTRQGVDLLAELVNYVR